MLRLRLLPLFRFSQQKKPQQPSSVARKIQDKLNQFNEKSKAQTQIIPKAIQKDEQSTRELRDVILYSDILKNQRKILIYDTNGIQYRQVRLYLLSAIAAAIGGYYLLQTLKAKNLSLKVELNKTKQGRFLQLCVFSMVLILIVAVMVKYRRLQRSTIQKIIYDTETSQFQFFRRNWYGRVYQQFVSKDKVMYTQNQKLWNKGINYYHLDTLEQFSISLEKGWVKGKEGLFSHLISQRIRLQMKKQNPK